MLSLAHAQLEQIYHHARQDYPRECCGIFLGHSDGTLWTVASILPARNLAEFSRTDRYLLDPLARFRAEEQAKITGKTVVGFYHSHPDHEVYFSETDLQNSEEYLMGEPWLPPTFAYLVVSLRNQTIQGHGAFIIRAGRSEPLEVRIE